MEGQIIEILVQSGLAGVALTSLYFNYKIVTNHIVHSTDASTRLEQAITKLITFLEEKFSDKI